MVMAFRSVTIWALALAVGLFISPQAHANSKYAAFVIHADSGDVFFDRYSTGRRYPASLTKMMTLYLLFEAIEEGDLTLESKIKVTAHAAGQPPSKLGLTSGSTIEVETAIKALTVKSANDVAAAVAEALGGSEWRFAQSMTAKARKLGMRNTTFRNASGLPNSKQVTTARDMAILGRRMIQDFPQYYHYFSTQSFTWDGRTYRTHNALVRTFDGADGLKTGYTRRSGFNLATSATRDGNRLIGVVLGGRSSATRDAHMRKILNEAFAAIKQKPNLIASLHRNTPEPRLKPTLLAALTSQAGAPTVAENSAMREEITMAAAAFASDNGVSLDKTSDSIGALIALADTDDFNEFQRNRLAALSAEPEFASEGDTDSNIDFTWSVQIGAYSTKDMAQRELENAVQLSGMDNRDRAVLPTPRNNGNMLYRARITRLTEIEATAACKALKTNRKTCFVVSDADTKLN